MPNVVWSFLKWIVHLQLLPEDTFVARVESQGHGQSQSEANLTGLAELEEACSVPFLHESDEVAS